MHLFVVTVRYRAVIIMIGPYLKFKKELGQTVICCLLWIGILL